MNENVLNFISVIIAFIVTRSIYWLSSFRPTKDMQFTYGLIVDFGIWIGIYLLTRFVLSKIVNKSNPKSA